MSSKAKAGGAGAARTIDERTRKYFITPLTDALDANNLDRVMDIASKDAIAHLPIAKVGVPS